MFTVAAVQLVCRHHVEKLCNLPKSHQVRAVLLRHSALETLLLNSRRILLTAVAQTAAFLRMWQSIRSNSSCLRPAALSQSVSIGSMPTRIFPIWRAHNSTWLF